MDNIVYHSLWFILAFLFIFLFYYFLLKRKYKKNKIAKIGEFAYLMKRFSLDPKKLPFSRMIIVISFINSFIMAFVSSFIMMLPLNMIWRLLIAFVLLFVLIYALYEIYGRHLYNKYKKD